MMIELLHEMNVLKPHIYACYCVGEVMHQSVFLEIRSYIYIYIYIYILGVRSLAYARVELDSFKRGK